MQPIPYSPTQPAIFAYVGKNPEKKEFKELAWRP